MRNPTDIKLCVSYKNGLFIYCSRGMSVGMGLLIIIINNINIISWLFILLDTSDSLFSLHCHRAGVAVVAG